MLPYGCTSWIIREQYDITYDSIDYLSKSFPVLIDRDYHGCAICYHMPLFRYIIDHDEMISLIRRFMIDDWLLNFRDETYCGNVLHNIVMNPNPTMYFVLINCISIESLRQLANEHDGSYQLPIEQVTNLDIFKHLVQHTNMTNDVINKCRNKSQAIDDYMRTVKLIY